VNTVWPARAKMEQAEAPAEEKSLAQRSGTEVMAKHGRRRKFRRYIRGNIDHDFTLGTLGGNTLIGSDLPDSVTESTWCSSVKATWSLGDFVTADNVGPILVGWAISDYTDGEIEAWLESTSSWEIGNLVAQEVGRRKCRIVGTFEQLTGETTQAAHPLNDGRPITTKLGWNLTTGDTLKAWAFNEGIVSLTSAVVHVHGHANLWPR